jgi:hypothetical protein
METLSFKPFFKLPMDLFNRMALTLEPFDPEMNPFDIKYNKVTEPDGVILNGIKETNMTQKLYLKEVKNIEEDYFLLDGMNKKRLVWPITFLLYAQEKNIDLSDPDLPAWKAKVEAPNFISLYMRIFVEFSTCYKLSSYLYKAFNTREIMEIELLSSKSICYLLNMTPMFVTFRYGCCDYPDYDNLYNEGIAQARVKIRESSWFPTINKLTEVFHQ